jgi:ankyrin repeat protein
MATLLISRGANVNARDAPGYTPLTLAVQSSNGLEVAKALLAGGADPEARGESWARTPLHWAAFKGNIWAAELLLVAGADVNEKDAHHYTPLHIASELGQLEMAKFLLQHGADVNASDTHGKTPLSIFS